MVGPFAVLRTAGCQNGILHALVATADQIVAFVQKVADLVRPSRIVLFGSYAYGTTTVDSDVDLLVIMPHRGPGHWHAARLRVAVDAPFPMDLLVHSPAQV